MAEDFEGQEVEGAAASAALGSLDFNVNDEYKPNPLIPKGTYHANAIKITFTPAQYAIVWSWCLHDNGGVMNDGESPIDGVLVFSRNWLPKPGDEITPTKSGSTNKRQSKINQLKDFQDALGIDMSTPEKIATALADAQWVGVEADVDVDIEEYQGRFRNVVNRVKKSSMF
jgi:hypothetical protein